MLSELLFYLGVIRVQTIEQVIMIYLSTPNLKDSVEDINAHSIDTLKAPKEKTLADLRIIKIEVTPKPTVSALRDSFLIRGLKYSFRVRVKNAGGPIRGAVAMAVSYGCPGRGSSNNLINLGNIAPGETRISDPFTVKIETNSGSGQCSFEFILDPYNVHQLINERGTTNKKVLIFKVP